MPNELVHEPSFPNARILAPSGIAGHNPISPFFGTSSPEPVQPIRRSAFCSTAAWSRGRNFALMLMERSKTSPGPAMVLRCSMSVKYPLLEDVLKDEFVLH